MWQLFKSWWWVLPVFLLWEPFLFIYRWSRIEKYDATVKRILLEIKLPKEVVKPVKAMETVFAGIHAIHDVFTWRELWIEGQYQLAFSFEIVSLGGDIHFYIRTPEVFRKIIESNVYSQYPEAEIFEVSDYTKSVPQNIPTKDWDLFGMDLVNTKDEVYPLKTYVNFEQDNTLEEKRIDPLSNLLEGFSALRPGEQLWMQIIAKPIREEKPWIKRGKEIRDQLARRTNPKAKPKSMLQEAFEIVVLGEVPEKKEEKKEVMPPEMKLTPGEREVLTAIENKISKFGYDCNIRFIYLGKRDVFFKPMARVPYTFFKAISSESMGGLKPDKHTITKVKSVFFWLLDNRRVYFRKRRMFRYYCRRMTPHFPVSGGTYVFNVEELATLYHFPGKTMAPASNLARIEAKKGEAPPQLPIEF